MYAVSAVALFGAEHQSQQRRLDQSRLRERNLLPDLVGDRDWRSLKFVLTIPLSTALVVVSRRRLSECLTLSKGVCN